MTRALAAVALLVLTSTLGCSKPGGGALGAKEAATDAAKYAGKKIKVTGVYTQGFSKGGRPADPWVLVIGDGPAIRPTMNCVIPAKVDIPGSYPKITAEGTVMVESGAGGRVYLTDCTYTIDK